MTRKRKGGPTSAAGKAVTSRNALRHGFSAKLYRPSPTPARIERLAQAIAADDSDPAVGAVAFRIAENELLLREIAAHKVWVVERLREPYANPFAGNDNSFQLETARAMQMWLAEREINARVPRLLEKYEVRMLFEELKESFSYSEATKTRESLRGMFPGEADRVDFIHKCWRMVVSHQYARLKACGWRSELDFDIPNRLMALMEEPDDCARFAARFAANKAAENDATDRDEFEALEAAMRDLVRLDRYEQRAWRRLKKAILELANLKLARRFSEPASGGGCLSSRAEQSKTEARP